MLTFKCRLSIKVFAAAVVWYQRDNRKIPTRPDNDGAVSHRKGRGESVSKVTTKSYTPREKRNLKLLSFGCHKISTTLSGPYGNRARGRSIQSRNLHRNGGNFRRCQSVTGNAAVAVVRQWHFPLLPRHSIFFSPLCAIVTSSTISPRQKRSVYHLPTLPSVTNKSVLRFLNGGYHTRTTHYVYMSSG